MDTTARSVLQLTALRLHFWVWIKNLYQMWTTYNQNYLYVRSTLSQISTIKKLHDLNWSIFIEINELSINCTSFIRTPLSSSLIFNKSREYTTSLSWQETNNIEQNRTMLSSTHHHQTKNFGSKIFFQLKSYLQNSYPHENTNLPTYYCNCSDQKN